MNDTTPLTVNAIYLWIGSAIVAIVFLVGALLLKDWVASVVSGWRAKKNGTNGRAAIAKNGDFQALINAQNQTKQAVVDGFADLAKVLVAGFDRIGEKLGEIRSDTDATRKIVEAVDDSLAHRVHNKPAVEKLIRKIASKLGIGGVN